MGDIPEQLPQFGGSRVLSWCLGRPRTSPQWENLSKSLGMRCFCYIIFGPKVSTTVNFSHCQIRTAAAGAKPEGEEVVGSPRVAYVRWGCGTEQWYGVANYPPILGKSVNMNHNVAKAAPSIGSVTTNQEQGLSLSVGFFPHPPRSSQTHIQFHVEADQQSQLCDSSSAPECQMPSASLVWPCRGPFRATKLQKILVKQHLFTLWLHDSKYKLLGTKPRS